MKQYGSKYATEFNKGDIHQIYKLAKTKEIQVEKWFMSRLYKLADYYGYDDSRSVAMEEVRIINLIENLKKDPKEEIQKEIDNYTKEVWNRLSKKVQEGLDKEYV